MPPAGGGAGAGGESVDTGGLPSGPEGGAGGGPSPFHYNPISNTTNINNRNITNRTTSSYYRGGDRDYSRTYNQQKQISTTQQQWLQEAVNKDRR